MMEKRKRQRQRKRWLQQLPIHRHFNRIIAICTEFLQRKLTAFNCIDTLFFAHNHGMHRLVELTASFIDVNFDAVFTSDEFFELTIDQLITLLPLLIYDEMTESHMEHALLLWSKYKRIERQKHIDLARPKYNSWQMQRTEQQQRKEQKLRIKTEPNHKPTESPEEILEATPPPRISN